MTLLDTKLDLEFVRKQFPAFSEPSLQGQAFFENAGGSYACGQVIERLTNYYRKTKVQPYYPYPASTQAGEMMDSSYQSFAKYLNIRPEEVMFGPSTTQNTYVLAHAMADYLQEGDEIIVTNQDHEANGGAWRRLAKRGIVVKEWQVNNETGGLETLGLKALLNDKTKLVTFPHCSNIVGEINPVTEWTRLAHAAGAAVVADGVSYAGHGFPDMQELGCDIYLFSLYKTYGPHQGAMVVREHFMPKLTNQSHYFNDGEVHKRLVPAGPDHAQVACADAVLDYVEASFAHHGGSAGASLREQCAEVTELWQRQEDSLTPMLLDAVHGNDAVRLLGPETLDATPGHRCPTIAFSPTAIEPGEVELALVERGVQTSAHHFYGWRVLDGMGVDPERGCVRLSFVHYTSHADIERVVDALGAIT